MTDHENQLTDPPQAPPFMPPVDCPALQELLNAVRGIDLYDDGDPILDEAGVRHLWDLADRAEVEYKQR